MSEWKDIKITGIAKIEKCVAEFNVWEHYKSPYAKFKIKIFEDVEGMLSGYSNLHVVDSTGSYYCAVGYGKTVEEALENTINDFLEMVSEDKEWTESDFECAESFDF